MKLVSLKSGWKTYAVVAAGVILGAIQGLDANGLADIHVPTWLEWLLGFLGAGTLRHGIQTQTATVISNVMDAIAAQPQVVVSSPSLPISPEVAKAIAEAAVRQHATDQSQADATQRAITTADEVAPKTKDELISDLEGGAK